MPYYAAFVAEEIESAAEATGAPRRGDAIQVRILEVAAYHVDAKAVDFAIHPKAEDIVHSVNEGPLRQLRSGCSTRKEWR